jgi:hypothetical protein
MNSYTTDKEYRTLVTTYEKAKALFKAAKAERKTLKMLFQASKNEEGTSQQTVSTSYFQYQKALLTEKTNKMAACLAKLALKEKVKLLKARFDKPKRVAKIEGIEMILFRNKYGDDFYSKKKRPSKVA